MNYRARLGALQGALQQQKFDILIVTHLPDVRYLCGFTGSAGVLVVGNGETRFFTDGRYTSQAKKEVVAASVTVSRNPPLFTAAEWLRRRSSRAGTLRVGIDGEHMTVATHAQLRTILPNKIHLRSAPPLVQKARMIKDAEEVVLLRRAVDLGSSLFETLLNSIRPGITEREVAGIIEARARTQGAEAMSFETIIASGKRSALPHGTASENPISARGFVVCDFGVILAGYCSDMTRTVYVGHVPREARAFYDAVGEAQRAALEAVQPGIEVRKVDQAARKVLRKAGLARYFSHSTGHGVGLEIHEAPRIASGQKEVLRPGMVITIEPGAYLPDKWGVRIEDMVLVTERGCDVLTPTTKELISI